jgi:AraC family transcriptional regulator
METKVVHVGPIPGFVIAEVQYEPRAYQSQHDHEEARLIVTIRGGFTECWGRRHHCCGPASVLLRPADELHTNRYDANGALCINVRFGVEWSRLLQEYGIRAGSNNSAEVGPLAGRLYRELRVGDSASPIGIQCGVLDIMTRFSRPQTCHRERHPPHWIEATKELLRSRLNSPPDVFETARLAGVHPAHLSRAFRQFTGMTIGSYLRRQRVEVACDRLRQPQHSLADIALETGFYDQAHFSRVFRQQTGVTPKEFRSLNRSS